MIKKIIWAIKNIIPYLWFGIWMSHISGIWRLSKQYGNYRGIVFFNSIANTFKHLLPSMVAVDLVVGLIGALVLRLIVYAWIDSKKDLRSGREFGGARWAKPKEMDPIRDKNFFNNVILTNTEWFSLTGKGGRFGSRNRNVLIIGGSGSGKTRYWLKPNLLQMHSSYVITDPKGAVSVR